jgi:hypothetical protein
MSSSVNYLPLCTRKAVGREPSNRVHSDRLRFGSLSLLVLRVPRCLS